MLLLQARSSNFLLQGTFIFASKNYSDCDKLLVLIHGSGAVRAGQWARR